MNSTHSRARRCVDVNAAAGKPATAKCTEVAAVEPASSASVGASQTAAMEPASSASVGASETAAMETAKAPAVETAAGMETATAAMSGGLG